MTFHSANFSTAIITFRKRAIKKKKKNCRQERGMTRVQNVRKNGSNGKANVSKQCDYLSESKAVGRREKFGRSIQ